jgi:segregation and condensation protein B
MRRSLEALLFASDQPLTLAKLASLLPDADRKEIRKVLDALREEYDRDERGFTIVEFGGGYSISTRPEEASIVRRLYKGRRKVRLSKAALECLAIIAYKQPVTRLEIEEIRGVSVSGVIGTLMERDLIAIVGRAETLGHPLLYGTTKALLDYLGLRSVKDLPQLSELEDLLAEREESKQLALLEPGSEDAPERVVGGESGPEPEAELTETSIGLGEEGDLGAPDTPTPAEERALAADDPDELRAATGRGGTD